MFKARVNSKLAQSGNIKTYDGNLPDHLLWKVLNGYDIGKDIDGFDLAVVDGVRAYLVDSDDFDLIDQNPIDPN